MKLKIIILLLFISSSLLAQPQDSLDLIECFLLTRENAPQLLQLQNNEQLKGLKERSIATGNLPQFSVYGKAWYQSDAVSVPPLGPGAEGLSIDRFQYNFGAEINQKIFDGGLAKKLTTQELLKLTANSASVNATIYQLYERVTDLYFSILLLDQNREILKLKSSYLDERLEALSSAFESGTLLRSEVEKLKVEKLTAQQQMTELSYSIDNLKENLTILLGTEETLDEIQLESSISLSELTIDKRPEYHTIDTKKELILASKELQSSSQVPKLFAYGQVGYSYPGLNFFENQSDPYYIVGLRLAWNIFDWNKTSIEKEMLDVEVNSLNVLREELDRKFEMATISTSSEIGKLENLIKTDQLIVNLKSSIVQSSTSAFDNGTITSSDYLSDVNAEIIARIEMNKHTIQLQKSKVQLALINGINIE